MLAVCSHMMQGTPYIYQGEELGMTNAPFADISDFRDLDSINAYRELTEKGIFSREEMLGYLRYKSRDNARTPCSGRIRKMRVFPPESRGLW